MKQSVRNAWLPWNAQFEGQVNWMYLDVKGLVTTGTGQLIDPVPAAQMLAWTNAGGYPVSQGEVFNEWQRVKNNVALAHQGAQVAKAFTALRCSINDLEDAALALLDRNETILKAHDAFAAFDHWPADAQLACLSMAWALGAGFPSKWPSFCGFLTACDFAGAASESAMSVVGNPGVAPRNLANANALRAAATTQTPDLLTGWPA